MSLFANLCFVTDTVSKFVDLCPCGRIANFCSQVCCGPLHECYDCESFRILQARGTPRGLFDSLLFVWIPYCRSSFSFLSILVSESIVVTQVAHFVDCDSRRVVPFLRIAFLGARMTDITVEFQLARYTPDRGITIRVSVYRNESVSIQSVILCLCDTQTVSLWIECHLSVSNNSISTIARNSYPQASLSTDTFVVPNGQFVIGIDSRVTRSRFQVTTQTK